MHIAILRRPLRRTRMGHDEPTGAAEFQPRIPNTGQTSSFKRQRFAVPFNSLSSPFSSSVASLYTLLMPCTHIFSDTSKPLLSSTTKAAEIPPV